MDWLIEMQIKYGIDRFKKKCHYDWTENNRNKALYVVPSPINYNKIPIPKRYSKPKLTFNIVTFEEIRIRSLPFYKRWIVKLIKWAQNA